jgi:LysM repeat protein
MMNDRIAQRAAFVLVTLSLLVGFGFLAATVNAADRSSGQVASPIVAWGGCNYIVQPGETLFSIGIRYGVSPYYLAQINGLYNPNFIYAGMPLEVPCGGYQPHYPPHWPPPPPMRCSNSTRYLVRPGDNLFRIALNYGTTVNALRDANNLWGRVLRAGMVLIIPCPGSVNYGKTPTPTTVTQVTPTPTPTTVPGTVPGVTPQTGPPALAPEPSAKVIIGFGPDPVEVSIKVNQSVVWVNNTGNTITIASGVPGQPNGVFDSGPIPNGGTWVHTFDTVGNYAYYVVENPKLTGQVNVTP